jgi:cytohesin
MVGKWDWFLKKAKNLDEMAGYWDNKLIVAAGIGDLIEVQTALENGANPNTKGEYGLTPLHMAASEGHVDVVRVLLERGANPNTKDNDGQTPLHKAALWGHVDVVRVLLEYGADPNTKDKDGYTPLHKAAQEGYFEIVKLLLERGADPNTKDNYGQTPLHDAAYKGYFEIVKLLLEHGADPRVANNWGHIPLDVANDSVIRSLLESALRNSYSGVPRMQANEATWVDNGFLKKAGNWDNILLKAAENGDLIEVQTALENRANPNTKDNDGQTPLHKAAQEGHVEIVKLLLERGANPNTKNNDGQTPLHWAALSSRVDVVRVLLERGADPNTKDNAGWTPLHEAAYRGRVEIVKILLERGADPNTKDNDGQTPLHKAAQEGDIDVVKILLERGADPNTKDNDGQTPLHKAACRGRVDVVKILLERGADPNTKDNDGQTPLHKAAQEGDVDVVRVLLEYGADPNTKDNAGWTPLHEAALWGHVDVVRVLLEYGADPRIANNEGLIPLDVANDSVIRSLLESALRNSYSGVPRMQGNEAARVNNGDIERKSNENETLPIEQQSVIKSQGVMQIPNYEILETIDEGGFATVYKARRKNDSLLVAIKVPKALDKDFVKELAVWLNLNHPNIVKLIDYDINPRPYMVMELMKGSLDGKTFDKDTATRIILDVLSGLKHAHEKGIIHGDIKPSNILLDENGRAKISDWGTAKISDITTSTNEPFTFIYAAPEQLDPQLGPIDEKTDVYQVCEVFYEILTGRPVFQGDPKEVHDKKLNMQITLPSSINPTLKDYDKIFLKCLSPKKEDRYSTRELISVLFNMQYGPLTTKNTAYAFVMLAYYAVQLKDNYEEALFWIKKINTVDTKDVIRSLENKIKHKIGTKEDILLKIELLRNQIGLSK